MTKTSYKIATNFVIDRCVKNGGMENVTRAWFADNVMGKNENKKDTYTLSQNMNKSVRVFEYPGENINRWGDGIREAEKQTGRE